MKITWVKIRFLIVLILVLFFGSMLLTGFMGAKESASRVRCMSHLKQLGLANGQYALDNNRTFPWVRNANREDGNYFAYIGMLYPNYADELKIFTCPSSRDKPMRRRNSPDSKPFSIEESRRSLSYAYGHDRKTPITESLSRSHRILADKYTTQDYTINPFPEGRRPNHWRSKDPFYRLLIGRMYVALDGSASWDNSRAMLEADPDTALDEDSDPLSDQTGPDWFSDPPDK